MAFCSYFYSFYDFHSLRNTKGRGGDGDFVLPASAREKAGKKRGRGS